LPVGQPAPAAVVDAMKLKKRIKPGDIQREAQHLYDGMEYGHEPLAVIAVCGYLIANMFERLPMKGREEHFDTWVKAVRSTIFDQGHH
jgi:hypothetical protein